MTKKQRFVLIRILIASALFLALRFFLPDTLPRWALLLCWLVPYLLIGYDILRKAWKGIVNRQPFDECFLMAVATLGALALGFFRTADFDEAVAVMLFYQIGELFQSCAVGRSRRSISELMDIRPDTAWLEKEDGTLVSVDPDEVETGSVIAVRPGERVPIDGVVLEGSSTLDTAALTGESLPREVSPGSEALSGCVNQTSLLRIRTTREFSESTASRILDLVENASSLKSRSEAFITRFARVYTPVVCYSALALAVLGPVVRLMLGMPADWGEWLMRALTFLVISCPCALVISIPLTFFAGLGGASRAGILVKGSNYLEALADTGVAVFDKTGTMTQGVFEVSGVHHAAIPEDELIDLAAHAECYSSHPISLSLQRALGRPVDEKRVSDVREVAGGGVIAMVDGKEVACGNGRLMREISVACDECRSAGTVVHIAVDRLYCGHILIADRLKPHAALAVAELKKAGVRRTVMLTGDREQAAKEIAGELGVDVCLASLLPQDKVTEVEKLLQEKKPREKVIFVGDGLNDAPVLSRADLGVAMGALGSDAAIEAADIVLMDDDPLKLPQAIAIARRCMLIVRENIVFAIGVKAVCLILSALGLANMWLAVFADVGVMVAAVLNAIRALKTPGAAA